MLKLIERLIEKCGIDIGNIVLSTAGRDKDRYFLVVKVEDNYVYLVDGNLRKVENPKKKKIKHIELTAFFDGDFAEKIKKNNKISNQDVKKLLKNLIKSN